VALIPESWRRTARLTAGAVADRLDGTGSATVTPLRETSGPGPAARAWALAKAGATALTLPAALPIGTFAALQSQQEALRRIRVFPEQLRAICEDRPGPLPVRSVGRLPASGRYVVTSDLHRCIPGRLDWPARQGTKDLYRAVLAGYAEDGWSVVENGDIEDFWMVGGSTWGACYDAGRLAAGFAGPLADATRRELLGDHLDRIVDNNADLYRVLAELARDGRYHRTVGNHDDVLADRSLVERLGEHLPGVSAPDAIVLGSGGPPRVETTAAVLMHGHLTDAWNGPGLATLGRATTWLATTVDDLPLSGPFDGLPGEPATATLLEGRGENRLISVDARFGGNRRFDSLDEERLFDRLAVTAPVGGWPWLMFGHTHFPMLRPVDASGRVVRYANSGCGVLPGAFTALEWDGALDDPLRLVVHHLVDGRPTRTELHPEGEVLAAGRP
jgi:hypothetical protein